MYNNVPASRLVPFGLLHVAKSIDLCQNIFLLTAYQLGNQSIIIFQKNLVKHSALCLGQGSKLSVGVFLRLMFMLTKSCIKLQFYLTNQNRLIIIIKQIIYYELFSLNVVLKPKAF